MLVVGNQLSWKRKSRNQNSPEYITKTNDESGVIPSVHGYCKGKNRIGENAQALNGLISITCPLQESRPATTLGGVVISIELRELDKNSAEKKQSFWSGNDEFLCYELL